MAKKFACGEGIAEVTTTQGKIRGYEYDGLTIFKGIPYATAKRFHKPQPVEPWEGVKECTSFGCTCPLGTQGAPNGELLVPHRYWIQDENCQNLNVWTPACDDAKRPVLVWLHGGGYSDGSAIEQKAYDGDALAKYGDVVVVTVNHRLNILGYFDVSDFGEEYENSGNAGTADTIASLRWVHDNIAAFGGDPSNVTIIGQSGGGGKVTALLQSPEADGLYQKGINMSGVIGPVLTDAEGSGREIAEAVMAELGITTVKELEDVPYFEFRRAYDKVSPALRAAGKYVGMAPQPNAHYRGEPVANGFREETKDIPLMVGSCFSEFMGFMPLPGLPEGAAKEQAVAMLDGMAQQMSVMAPQSNGEPIISHEYLVKLVDQFAEVYPNHPLTDALKLDFIFRAPEIAYLTARSALNHCTYSYLFDVKFPINGGATAWHCSDIPFVFHHTDLVEVCQFEEAEAVEKLVTDTLLAFMRTSDPNNSEIPKIEANSPDAENTLVITNSTAAVRTNFDHEIIAGMGEGMGRFLRILMGAMMGSVQH